MNQCFLFVFLNQCFIRVFTTDTQQIEFKPKSSLTVASYTTHQYGSVGDTLKQRRFHIHVPYSREISMIEQHHLTGLEKYMDVFFIVLLKILLIQFFTLKLARDHQKNSKHHHKGVIIKSSITLERSCTILIKNTITYKSLRKYPYSHIFNNRLPNIRLISCIRKVLLIPQC